MIAQGPIYHMRRDFKVFQREPQGPEKNETQREGSKQSCDNRNEGKEWEEESTEKTGKDVNQTQNKENMGG